MRSLTLRDSRGVCRSPHPPRSGPPSPQGEGHNARLKWGETCNVGRSGLSQTSSTAEREWRVKSGEWRWQQLRKRELQCRAFVSIETSSTAKRSPFPYEGKALTPLKLGRDLHCRVRHFHCPASEALPLCPTAGGCSPSRAPAGRSPSPARVGWRGLPLRTNSGADSGFRRTYGIHPRRASALRSGLR